MARKNEDRFGNLASSTVTMSAANTLTYAELATGISLGQGIGMLIDQIDYYFTPGTITQMANADQLIAAWLTSNSPTALTLRDRRVIHQTELFEAHEAGGGVTIIHLPIVHQFFPPLIVAAPRLYLGMNTVGIAGAGEVTSRLYFRYITLTDKEYLELAETFILVG